MLQPKCDLLDRVIVFPRIWQHKFQEWSHRYWLIIELKNSIIENTLSEEYMVKQIWWLKMCWVKDENVVKLKDIIACYKFDKLSNVKQSRWFVWFQNNESELIKNYIYHNKISKDELLSNLDDKEIDYSSM